MKGWTWHAAVRPAQATWHGHGKRRFVDQRTAHMETTLSQEADTAMYEDEDDDRFEAALRLAEVDEARAAEALRSIVADDAFDPDTRFEAAARLAEVDEARAAEALRSIVADDAFDPDTRSEAAARLAEVGG
jgi:aminopeptidase N